MKYVSTRDAMACASGAQAIVCGIAPGGGLYVPESVPRTITPQALWAMKGMDYPERVAQVLAPWLDDFSHEQMLAMCRAAYTRFDTPRIAPVRALSGGISVLELWHGPTLAFKDMALQLMPHLMTASLRQVGERRDILILVATSGDTGKAALEGFMDVEGVKIAVFYPEGGVSEAQRMQMITQEGDNTWVSAVRGNFDDAQNGVKRIFTSAECASWLDRFGTVLSSANSINLGRLVPQIAYYVSAYVDMMDAGTIAMGEEIDVCVPTGNFGNILAAHYARQMGLPIGRLVCASNENNVLTDFLATGRYDRRRDFHLTTSPSMDILISSNLERLLFELAGRDDAQVRAWMRALADEGCYQLPADQLAALGQAMVGGWADEADVADEIRSTLERDRYLIDPHTAVAMRVARHEKKGDRAMLVVSTASPYKFGRSVYEALGGDARALDDFACCDRLAAQVGQSVPEAIRALPAKPRLHERVCETDQMWAAVSSWIEGNQS